MGTKKTEKQPKQKDTKKVTEIDEALAEKQAKDIDQYIRQTLGEIRDKSNLSDFDIQYRFSSKRKIRDRAEVYAEIAVDSSYLNAHMTIRPPVIELYKKDQKDKIKKILCHEIAHIRTEKLIHLASSRFVSEIEVRQENEKLTEILGRLMFNSIYKYNEPKLSKGK